MVTSLPHTSRASSLWRTVSAAALTSALTGFSGAGCCGDCFSSPQPAARTRAARRTTGRGRGMARVMPSMRRKQASGGRGTTRGWLSPFLVAVHHASLKRVARVPSRSGSSRRSKSRERRCRLPTVLSCRRCGRRNERGWRRRRRACVELRALVGIGVASVEGCAADYYGRGFAVFALDDGRCGGGGRRGRDVGCGVGARGGEPGLQCGVDGGGGLRADGSAAGAACRSWRAAGAVDGVCARGRLLAVGAGGVGRLRGRRLAAFTESRRRRLLGVRDARDGRAAASTGPEWLGTRGALRRGAAVARRGARTDVGAVVVGRRALDASAAGPAERACLSRAVRVGCGHDDAGDARRNAAPRRRSRHLVGALRNRRPGAGLRALEPPVARSELRHRPDLDRSPVGARAARDRRRRHRGRPRARRAPGRRRTERTRRVARRCRSLPC